MRPARLARTRRRRSSSRARRARRSRSRGTSPTARSRRPSSPFPDLGSLAMKATTTDQRLRIAIGVLCLIGIGIAGYLTYVHYAGLKVLCLSSGGCETVQASRYAKLGGIPVATLGLVGYIVILGSLALRG